MIAVDNLLENVTYPMTIVIRVAELDVFFISVRICRICLFFKIVHRWLLQLVIVRFIF